ncbi:Secreted protein [Rhodococcus sp. AW25M09]|uniref:hypothetical protein n=1 Tax=Rhodococcus sp. AW25M09 TaxID=1268303 RepID=UPI0002ABCD3D|nr:hypothetical protein [Rhodococcus sp. AW25M09]CCQ15565.1 Secreted protein [Rhodococcus sp. AW25M09]
MRTARIALFVGMFAALAACSTDAPTQPLPVGPAPSVSITVSATTSPPAPPQAATPEAEDAAPVAPTDSESAVAEPVIVDCETGLGPVTTYWSDGTVTGYSDYCQSVHDQVLQREIDANKRTCDGTVCTFQNGGTIPDPDAVPDDRCTNQIDYANDPRSNAEINSLGESNGQCPAPIG